MVPRETLFRFEQILPKSRERFDIISPPYNLRTTAPSHWKVCPPAVALLSLEGDAKIRRLFGFLAPTDTLS